MSPLSPRDPRDALCQSKCCPTVVWRMQTDRVSAWGAVSATVTFYSATCVVLYTYHCSRLNYRTASTQCIHVMLKWAIYTCDRLTSTLTNVVDVKLLCCYQQTSTTTYVADDTAYSSISAPSWMQTTMADGHKFSMVMRLSRRLLERSKNAIFTYPTCTWHLRWGDPIGIS